MDVFISWSGERSRAAAETLRNWLPKVIKAIRPCLTVEDVEKDARSGPELAAKLGAAKAGIICLTPGNRHSFWICVESTGLAMILGKTFVFPLLIGLEKADLKGLMAPFQFQAMRAVKGEILKLLRMLNAALGEAALSDGDIYQAFDLCWPELDAQLQGLPPDRDWFDEYLSMLEMRVINQALNQLHISTLRFPLVSRPKYNSIAESMIQNEIIEAFQDAGEEITALSPSSRLANGSKLYKVTTKRGDSVRLLLSNNAALQKSELKRQIETYLEEVKRRGAHRRWVM